MPTVETVAESLMGIPNLEWHIVVVDNASSDKTAQKVREHNHPGTTVLEVFEKGKGQAIRAAAGYADADLFGFIDADLSAHPSAVYSLLQEIQNGADIAIGSRLLDPRAVRRGFLRTLSSRAFNAIRKYMLGINVVDSQCGLKIMNRSGVSVLNQCKENTWFLDVELLARAQDMGLKISEVPIRWDENHYKGRVSKLSVVRDGFGAIKAFFRIRQNMRVS